LASPHLIFFQEENREERESLAQEVVELKELIEKFKDLRLDYLLDTKRSNIPKDGAVICTGTSQDTFFLHYCLIIC
jgi:hypothetical protein